jgi:hypothetical protein
VDTYYIRYNYGPFDSEIYKNLSELEKEKTIITHQRVMQGNEFIIYEIKEDIDVDIKLFASNEQREAVDDLLLTLNPFSAKELTDISYKTKPMIDI